MSNKKEKPKGRIPEKVEKVQRPAPWPDPPPRTPPSQQPTPKPDEKPTQTGQGTPKPTKTD